MTRKGATMPLPRKFTATPARSSQTRVESPGVNSTGKRAARTE